MTKDHPELTHFGFRNIAASEKSKLVADVFHSVAPQYDLMNDVMSFGLHRLWKRLAIAEADLQKGQFVLDVASGTGDLACLLASKVSKTGKIVMTDINEDMLILGRNKLTDKNLLQNINCVLADAETLPFSSNSFDRITIAFGLRNVTDKSKALAAMLRVLKPGGRLIILEFSKPRKEIINKFYEFYSFKVIPKMGELIARDKNSYDYLVESIRMHPNQEELKQMMEQAGFEDVNYRNLHTGIVALHKGYKY